MHNSAVRVTHSYQTLAEFTATTLHFQNQQLVFAVCANPEPEERIVMKKGKCPVTATDANGPDISNLLEAQRRMASTGAPHAERNSCPALDLGW
jgi:hypothetical protein